ncbi:GNAT family N-acetyltransferase [Antarcticirhabdus aurantiaca]|uniref:GNAT family N-acetyltransferase n=1 Tax=Antarcticirhabdus aurantiaca TaxID=2606717 RepID=A0ACD4NV40_9HYPH|nr:GNAT family N-acetyltransferase [Antarcticirhabdus aurantiaca]WAJ30588.1 GNAT family N-acetyltransferase [Jeongeuplla avenae]
MTPTIRQPTPGDVPRLHALIRDHAAFERSTASLTAEALEALLRETAIRFLVAEGDGELQGYAAVTFDWSVWRARRYAHLDCLFVAEIHRGRGIGRWLLSRARELASSEGVDRMEWQTPAWNEDACRFYVREGASCESKARFSLALP